MSDEASSGVKRHVRVPILAVRDEHEERWHGCLDVLDAFLHERGSGHDLTLTLSARALLPTGTLIRAAPGLFDSAQHGLLPQAAEALHVESFISRA